MARAIATLRRNARRRHAGIEHRARSKGATARQRRVDGCLTLRRRRTRRTSASRASRTRAPARATTERAERPEAQRGARAASVHESAERDKRDRLRADRLDKPRQARRTTSGALPGRWPDNSTIPRRATTLLGEVEADDEDAFHRSVKAFRSAVDHGLDALGAEDKQSVWRRKFIGDRDRRRIGTRSLRT